MPNYKIIKKVLEQEVIWEYLCFFVGIVFLSLGIGVLASATKSDIFVGLGLL